MYLNILSIILIWCWGNRLERRVLDS